MSTVSAAEFNRSPSKVKREAREHPVIVTERDRPSIVVLSYETYRKLQGAPENLAEWLRADDEFDLEIPPRTIEARPDPFSE